MPRSSGSPDIKHVLLEERLIGYLDPGAEKFLKPINEGGLTTTSSCTGRINHSRWEVALAEGQV